MALQTKVYSKTSNTFTLELTLVENSTSTAGNTSSVSYTLKLKSTTKNFAQYGVGAKVELDGKTVAVRDRGTAPKITLGTYSEVTLLSGTATVGHDSDGSKTMDIFFELDMASASYTPGYVSKSDTMTLTNIPRGATITSAQNFTDEDSPTVKISNPAGATVEVCIKTEDESNFIIAYKTASNSTYTFNFTQAEREALQKYATQNTATVAFVLRSVLYGQTYFSVSKKTLTIKNPAPTLAPVVEDVNPDTLALTGDAGVIVRYKSNSKVTTGAQAVKFATIKSQSVKCGGKSLNGDGTISGPEFGDFSFSVTDSRGNTTTKTIKKTLIPYVNLTCYIGQGVPNALGEFDLSVSGDCFNGNFGVSENQITVEFRFATQGTELGDDWLPMTVVPSGNGYTATANIEGLDYRKTYVFQARVTDFLGTVESGTKIVVSRPLAEWGADYWKFNVPTYINDCAVVASKILFDGRTNGKIDISGDISGFRYLEILFEDNNGVGGGYTRVLPKSGRFSLWLMEPSAYGRTYIRRTSYQLNGTTITPESDPAGGYVRLDSDGKISVNTAQNYVYITRVVGIT